MIKKYTNGSWSEVKYKKYGNKTEEFAEFPITIKGDGNDLMDYNISGNMSQTGTPTPTTPIPPSECGERTAQLFDEEYPNMKVDTTTYRKIYVGDGTFTLSTTTAQYRNTADLFFLAGNVISGASTQSNGVWNGNPRTVAAVDGYVTIAYRYYANDEASDPRNNDVMLNTGSTALPYEPYGYKLDISSGGENLFDPDILLEAVGWTKDNNIYSGNSAALHSKFNSFDKCIPVDADVISMSVMFRYAKLNTPLFIVFWYTDGTNTNTSKNGKAGEWTYLSVESDANKTLKGVAFSYGTNDLVELKDIMLNRGSTALPYEPYNRTTTPIYLGEVETTRKIKKVVLDGTENWGAQVAQGGNRFVLLIQNAIASDTSQVNSICSHFPLLGTGGTYTNPLGYTIANSSIYLRYDPMETVTDFKTYLAQQYAAGTPVTVWYVLAAEETGIVNEPLRKIGDYADTLSYEQAGVDIPTVKGNTVIDVLTELKPSEMSLSYKTWSEANAKIYLNGAWTDTPTPPVVYG